VALATMQILMVDAAEAAVVILIQPLEQEHLIKAMLAAMAAQLIPMVKAEAAAQLLSVEIYQAHPVVQAELEILLQLLDHLSNEVVVVAALAVIPVVLQEVEAQVEEEMLPHQAQAKQAKLTKAPEAAGDLVHLPLQAVVMGDLVLLFYVFQQQIIQEPQQAHQPYQQMEPILY